MTDTAMLGVGFDHYDPRFRSILLQMIKDEQFSFAAQTADNGWFFQKRIFKITLIERFPQGNEYTPGGQGRSEKPR